MPRKAKTHCSQLRIGSIYRHPKYGVIYMVDGYYLDPTSQRISNYWTARAVRKDGHLGREVGFYGEDMLCLDDKYDIVLKLKTKKKTRKKK